LFKSINSYKFLYLLRPFGCYCAVLLLFLKYLGGAEKDLSFQLRKEILELQIKHLKVLASFIQKNIEWFIDNHVPTVPVPGEPLPDGLISLLQKDKTFWTFVLFLSIGLVISLARALSSTRCEEALDKSTFPVAPENFSKESFLPFDQEVFSSVDFINNLFFQSVSM